MREEGKGPPVFKGGEIPRRPPEKRKQKHQIVNKIKEGKGEGKGGVTPRDN